MAVIIGEGELATRIEYNPLPSQDRFHQSTARFKGYSGSIGSGKSLALCQEALRLAYSNPGRLGLIGAPTYPMLRDATLTSLIDLLEANDVPYDLHKSDFVLYLPVPGSRILLRSLDRFERLRGTNLAWFGIDELSYLSEDAWLRLEGRLRDPEARQLCGFAVWTPKGYDWVYKRFMKDSPGSCEVVVARPFENQFLLDAVPDFYERLKSSYDERFFRQEVLGEYLNAFSGQVYRAFRREEHVMQLPVDQRRPLLWALDFNVDPMSSVVAQIDGETVIVLDEIVMSRASTMDACAEFHHRFPSHPAEIVVYGDASGQSLKTSGTTDFQMIRDYFSRHYRGRMDYRVPKSNPSVRDRILRVNAKLRNAAGEIQMLVAPKCVELIKDLEEVSYKNGTSAVDKGDQKRTHLSDALGYLIWQECQPRIVIGEQGRRLM